MKESENSNILLFSKINILDVIEIIKYYSTSWKASKIIYIIKKNIAKNFYFELNEEFDSSKPLQIFKALSKLFQYLINTNKLSEPFSIFGNSENLLKKEEMSKAYEYDIFESLISTIAFLYSKFISYNEYYFNIEK